MTDRVSHHAHPSQQEKDSGQGASHRTENSDENDVKVVDGPVHGWFLGSFGEVCLEGWGFICRLG